MTNKLKIDLSKARFSNFKKVFDPLEKCLAELEIDFYVIGALARDMIFSIGRINTRATADIDLAVFIQSNEGKYLALQAKLCKDYNFDKIRENNLSLKSPEGIIIDLVPFGAIEVNDGEIIKGKGLSSIKVNGFKEVQQYGIQEVESEDEKIFKLADLASIVLLKLIAFDDRPEMRENDPGDVASIIANFFTINSELIYENHNDLFENDGFELETLSARVIGRQIKRLLKGNDKLANRVNSILENHIEQFDKSKFLIKMVGKNCKELNIAFLWLKKIQKGINE